ncbi:g2595 [Coccomyxa elongata]
MEAIALARGGVEFSVDEVRTSNGKWSSKGVIFLTNMRMIFVANHPDAASGLVAFELPFAYITGDKFKQPVFGCNNLAGKCWPAVPGGGPLGTLPPHNFVIYFKEGGVGTFLPLYFNFLEYVRVMQQRVHSNPAPCAPVQPPQATQEMLSKAFVDPNDPSKVFLTSPVDESQRIPTAPQYAPNYTETQHERYQDMGLRP